MNVASSQYGGCDDKVRNFKGEDTSSQARRSAWRTHHGTVVDTKQNYTVRSVTKIGQHRHV